MTVFDVFSQISYDYLTLSRGTVYGNRITSSRTLQGVFKLRDGMTEGLREDYAGTNATLHAHPEDFADTSVLIGNAVRIGGITYRIAGITAGTNFSSGACEHLTFSLEREDELAQLPEAQE